MKLYFSQGACALGPQIALREAGMKFDMVKVDLKAKTLADGGDFKKINPKGYVPVLELDNGQIMTEGAVILQWIADQAPDKNLFPKWGSAERYKAMEWLHFIATEFHKGIGAFFTPEIGQNETLRPVLIEKLKVRFNYLNEHLKSNQFILGSQFSVVDAYAFNVLRWTSFVKIDISQYAGILGMMERVGARDSVRAALEAEGFKQGKS